MAIIEFYAKPAEVIDASEGIYSVPLIGEAMRREVVNVKTLSQCEKLFELWCAAVSKTLSIPVFCGARIREGSAPRGFNDARKADRFGKFLNVDVKGGN